MRLYEFASAEEQLALWKLVNDSVWQSLATQAKQQAEEQAAKQQMAKLKPKKGLKAKLAPPLPIRLPQLPKPKPPQPQNGAPIPATVPPSPADKISANQPNTVGFSARRVTTQQPPVVGRKA